MTQRSWWILALIAVLGIWGLVRWAPPVVAFPTYTCDPATGNCDPFNATAGSLDSNCAQCHKDFNLGNYTSLADGQDYGDTLMNLHKTMLANDCATCHFQQRSPVFLNSSPGGTGLAPISCIGCHGRQADRSTDGSRCVDLELQRGPCGDGAGLRLHHYNVNRTISTNHGPVSTRICANCHADANPANFVAAGENVAPPYYFTPDANHPDKPTDPCNPAPDYVEKMRNSGLIVGSLDGLNNDGDRDVNGPLYDQFDPDCRADLCAGKVCDDSNVCTDDRCDPATGNCVFTNNTAPCDDGLLCTVNDACVGGVCVSGNPVHCDDGNVCTTDSCDSGTGQCVFLPIPLPLEVGRLDFTDIRTLIWDPSPNATHWNSYRGTIPSRGLGSRLPGSVYDHTCYESGDAASDGATLSIDPSTPPLGTAFYYDATGENACAEGPLGSSSSGAVRPNTAPCPTPP